MDMPASVSFCIIFVLIGACLFNVGRCISPDTAVRRSQPGLGSPAKLWWAKEITPDFHVAGRLTYRQIKYTLEAGFKSIFSLFIYEDNDPGSFGGEYLPTTTEAAALARSLGLGYASLIDKNGDWWTEETIRAFSEAIENLPRPIMLHCNRGYTITFVTLMHMANLTRGDPEFEPKIYSDNFYRIVAAMGLDFTADHLRDVVSNVTGEPLIQDPPKPDCVPTNWRDFWLAHPIAKNWYSAGQIRRCDVKALEKTGFKAVVNLRMGLMFDGKPSQGKVTLLNVRDDAETYGTDTDPPRQSPEMLERSRINPSLDPDFIEPDSYVNYEKSNPDEFGDVIGYNEELEREFFVRHALAYYHLPINYYDEYSKELFNNVRDTLMEAGKKGPVLIHSHMGKRSAYIGVLAAAVQEGYDLNWALKRVQELGFSASPEERPDVYRMYRDVLGPGGVGESNKDEL